MNEDLGKYVQRDYNYGARGIAATSSFFKECSVVIVLEYVTVCAGHAELQIWIRWCYQKV
jgi:hypothetical protein